MKMKTNSSGRFWRNTSMRAKLITPPHACGMTGLLIRDRRARFLACHWQQLVHLAEKTLHLAYFECKPYCDYCWFRNFYMMNGVHKLTGKNGFGLWLCFL